MHAADVGIEIEFDFVDHVLRLRTTDGRMRSVALEPQSVASFYEATMTALQALGVRVRILARPVEIRDAIPFAEDVRHVRTTPTRCIASGSRSCRSIACCAASAARFVGKASPVHFFWGGFDLATTRFSGRPAPLHPGGVPNCADWVMQEAYSHEVSSCGFWPGGSEEGSFYSYAYPEPEGFRTGRSFPTPRATTRISASSCCRIEASARRPIPRRCS